MKDKDRTAVGVVIGTCDKCERPVRVGEPKELHPTEYTWRHTVCPPRPLVALRLPSPPEPAA